jgi:hypothetical protein
MAKKQAERGQVAAAKRGQIIQRVLIDGWSPGRTAAEYAITERQVVRWVAAYRRHGMASLRADAASDERAIRRWLWRLWTASARLLAVPGIGINVEPARCIALHPDEDTDAKSHQQRL